MTEHRWSKFWWQDWQADQALRSCSLAARGLWMDMLCIAHSGTPRGHVTINGQAVTTKRLATLAGTTEKECAKLLAELEEAGVFSRTPEGVVFSRRMVRDTEHAEAGREAVGKRWTKRDEPSGGPTSTPITPPITPPNTPPIRGATRTPSTQESEAEEEKEIEIPVSVPKPADAERAEAAAEPQWPPPPLASAVTAAVGVLAAKLEGRHRDTKPAGPVAPRRTVDEQVAVLSKPKVRANYASDAALKRARAELALRVTPAGGNA